MYVGEKKENYKQRIILTLLQMVVSILLPFHARIASRTLKPDKSLRKH
jgi:hypothetical protein